MPWRLIESPPADIFTQMGLDKDLFETFVQDLHSFPILRVYQVAEPSITVGCSYRKRFRSLLRAQNLTFWKKKLPLCVRPTGGGLVEHGNDLIYSVIARRDSYPTFDKVRTSYLSFHEAILEAFRNLGIETRLLRCDEAKRRSSALSECFNEPVATDLLMNERKIAGGAQWRRREAFLHQGSIQIPDSVSFERLKIVLIEAFQKKFITSYN